MKKKLPNFKLFKIVFLFTLCAFSKLNAQVSVTVDGSAEWIGYANVFSLTGDYLFGNPWGLADLKSIINPTNNTVTLYPNYNNYNAADAYWANGAIGNKIFEGNTYIENSALAGNTVTFSGHVISNTLASGYENVAFIKGLNPATGYSTDVLVTAPLTAGQDFNVVATNIPAGLVVQYGFKISGLNANPAAEAELGNVVVTATNLSVAKLTKAKTAIYPNPAHNILNFSSETNIETMSVYNMLGQNVLTFTPNPSQDTIDISGLTNGVYILTSTSNGKTDTLRFIKE